MTQRRLPPPGGPKSLGHGFTIESYEVGSWCPTSDGSGPASAVGLSLNVKGLPVLVMRLKTPGAVDRMIQSLLRHKRDVWPEAS